MDVRLPDGKIIKNVPDGTTKAELISKLKSNGYDVSGLEVPQVQQQPDLQERSVSNFMQAAQSPIAQNMLSGPIGMAAQGVGSAMDKTFGPETAYKVGGAVTDFMSNPQNRQALSVMQAMGMPVPAQNVEPAQAGAISNVGVQAVPMAIGGGAGKQIAKGGGEFLMQQALKPTKGELLAGKGMSAVRTLLGEGINVSPGGVAKLQRMIEELNKTIADRIANSTAKVDKQEVINYTMRTIDKFRHRVSRNADLKSITDAIDEFASAYPEQISVQLAQKIKQATWQGIGETEFNKLKTAAVEVQKDLAHGMKNEIAKLVDVGSLNARDSKLIEAHTMALSRVLMEGNKSIVSLAWLAKHPAAALGYVAEKSPFILSILARSMYGGGVGAAVGAAAGAAGPRIKELMSGNQ